MTFEDLCLEFLKLGLLGCLSEVLFSEACNSLVRVKRYDNVS